MRPLVNFDPHYRAHPKKYSRTTEIVLKAGTFSYNLPEDNFLADKDIYGMFTRRQSAGNDRKTKTNRLIAADAVLNVAFLTISNGSAVTLDSYPLENMVSDTNVNGPGQYDQLAFPPGTKYSSCKIEFPAGTALVNDTAIEITTFFDFDDGCN